jgi:3-deoxy-D-manno-octulosonate 8-phosphate phosphatase (KDO 8-P phosphatase)
MKADLKKRLALIKMILMDNDGVLTDGGLYYGMNGVEFVVFNVKDGLGIKLAHMAGLMTGIISGLQSKALKERASMLGVTELHMSVMDKNAVYEQIKKKQNLEDSEIAFIGDDVIDLPILKRCGIAVAVADAHPELINDVHIVTKLPGGKGAVRELIDLVLEAKGIRERIYKQYTK